MKLGTVLTATDLNPLYAEFIPGFIATWKALLPEADVVIVLIAEEIPSTLQQYADNIRIVKPLPGIHTSFQAQCIRLLYPRMITRPEGVIISDMDMFPLSRRYYVDTIAHIPSDAFIVYRDGVLTGEYPMCYVAGHPHTWASIFGNAPTEDIIKSWWMPQFDGRHGGVGWSTDQRRLFAAVNAWPGLTVKLNDHQTHFRRLDRADNFHNNLQEVCNRIRDNVYSDYHSLRPYSKYRAINDIIVDVVCGK